MSGEEIFQLLYFISPREKLKINQENTTSGMIRVRRDIVNSPQPLSVDYTAFIVNSLTQAHTHY